MENETSNKNDEEKIPALSAGADKNLLPISIILAAAILAGAWIYVKTKAPPQPAAVSESPGIETSCGIENQNTAAKPAAKKENSGLSLQEKVLPSGGIVLPVRWGDLGIKLTGTGVIDLPKLEAIYGARGDLSADLRQLLRETVDGSIKMTPRNSGLLLNVFWALGLGNKNPILEQGPMATYDGFNPKNPEEVLIKAANFASTGGWTVSKGNPMDHYSRHPFMILTPEQQTLVEKVATGIYRPCCGNSVLFPDCNHGMAMLGLLELLASQGVGEKEMYKIALQVNAYWFPDTYLTLAKYWQTKGVEWNKINPAEVLGAAYSSGPGYQKILSQVEEVKSEPSGGGCGV